VVRGLRQFLHKWDESSFDPEYPTLPLETFEPYVNRIFSLKPHIRGTRERELTPLRDLHVQQPLSASRAAANNRPRSAHDPTMQMIRLAVR